MPKEENAWLEFCNEPNPFPRALAKWQPAQSKMKEGYPRWNVNSEEEYLEGLYRNKDRGMAVSLMGEPCVKAKTRTKVFIELGDSSTLRQAHSTMQSMCRTLDLLFDATPAVLYSANKSFHIHLGIRALELKSTKFKPVKESVEHIINIGKKAGLIEGVVDWDIGLSDDWRRMGRPPYTLHPKSLLKYERPRYVTPVEPKWTLHKILQESRRVAGGAEFRITESGNSEIRRLLKDTDRVLLGIEEAERDISNKNFDITNIQFATSGRQGDITNRYRALVKKLLDNANRIIDGQHRILWHLLIPALQCGGFSWNRAWKITEAFLLRSGVEPRNYEKEALYWWNRKNEEGKPFIPMSKREFLERYPNLNEVLK